MFWIFTGFVGLMMFAVTLGKYSVWFAMLKVALKMALIAIAGLGGALAYRRLK